MIEQAPSSRHANAVLAIIVASYLIARLAVHQLPRGPVAPQDAGAASGLVNVAHQLGGSLGLGLLVVVFTAASDDPGLSEGILAHRISAVLDVGALLMLLALAVSWFCIARPQRVARLAAPPTCPLKERS